MFSSQNHHDKLGDLRGVLKGCEVSMRKNFVEPIQSMCLFGNNGVIFHNSCGVVS